MIQVTSTNCGIHLRIKWVKTFKEHIWGTIQLFLNKIIIKHFAIDNIIWKTTSGKDNLSSYCSFGNILLNNMHTTRTLLGQYKDFDRELCQEHALQTLPMLNEDQRHVVDSIITSYEIIQRNIHWCPRRHWKDLCFQLYH